MQATIPTGNLVTLTKPNPQGEVMIYLRYYLGKYAKKTTDIKVPEKDWDAEAQRVKPSNKNASRLNALLSSIKANIDDKLYAYDGNLTYSVLVYILNGEETEAQRNSRKSELVDYALQVNEMRYSKKEYGYTMYYNKKKCIEAFDTFLKHYAHLPSLALGKLNVAIFDQYIQYRTVVLKNTSREGINKTLVPLYSAIKYAVDTGIVEMKDAAPIINNYLELKDTEYNPEEKADEKIKYMTHDQMQALHDIIPKMKNPRTQEIIEIFFFAFYACGMRISDIMTLEWSHIDWEARTICKTQFKTKKEPDVDIPISDSALEILLKWKDYNRNKRFVFDLLPEGFDMSDQKALFQARNTKDKTFNRSLLTVSMTLRMPFPITMHVARHTFAVMAINEGISIYLLSKLLGHSSISATEQTYAEFLKEKVGKDTEALLKIKY